MTTFLCWSNISTSGDLLETEDHWNICRDHESTGAGSKIKSQGDVPFFRHRPSLGQSSLAEEKYEITKACECVDCGSSFILLVENYPTFPASKRVDKFWGNQRSCPFEIDVLHHTFQLLTHLPTSHLQVQDIWFLLAALHLCLIDISDSCASFPYACYSVFFSQQRAGMLLQKTQKSKKTVSATSHPDFEHIFHLRLQLATFKTSATSHFSKAKDLHLRGRIVQARRLFRARSVDRSVGQTLRCQIEK